MNCNCDTRNCSHTRDRVEWRPQSSILTTLFSILLGSAAIGTAIYTAAHGHPSTFGVLEHMVAEILGVFAAPIPLFTNYMQFPGWVWYMVLISWGILPLYGFGNAAGIAKIEQTTPRFHTVIVMLSVPAVISLVGTAIASGGTQLMAKLWLMMTFNVTMLPVVLMTDVFTFTPVLWAVIVAGAIATAVSTKAANRVL